MTTPADEGPENMPPPDGELSRERVDREHLRHIDRQYLYTDANFIRLLGMEGNSVVAVKIDSGLIYLTTREKRMR